MKAKQMQTNRRARRTRARLHGTAEVPRLSVKRSAKHLYAQLIDDAAGETLAAISDTELKVKGKPVERAKEIGRALAKKAVAAGITRAIFDRGSNRYHGRVAALADGAREGGLKI